jgi:hypothetical protein
VCADGPTDTPYVDGLVATIYSDLFSMAKSIWHGPFGHVCIDRSQRLAILSRCIFSAQLNI